MFMCHVLLLTIGISIIAQYQKIVLAARILKRNIFFQNVISVM